MANVLTWLGRLFKFLFGVGNKESGNGDAGVSELPRVKMYVDHVPKEGISGTIHPNAYQVEIDRYTLKTKMQTVDIDLGFVKLMVDGRAAKTWRDSALVDVDVNLPIRVTFEFGGSQQVKYLTVKNASRISLSLDIPEGLQLDGFHDGEIYHVSHVIKFKIEVWKVDNIQIVYPSHPTGYVIGYTDIQEFETEAMLYASVLKLRKDEGKVKEIDDRPVREIVNTYTNRIIRSSPINYLFLNKVKNEFGGVEVKYDSATVKYPNILVVIDDKLLTTGLNTFVYVNNKPVVWFSVEHPWRYAYIEDIEYGKRYDVDIKFAVDSAVFPPAMVRPVVVVSQLKQEGEGYVHERDVLKVVGEDILSRDNEGVTSVGFANASFYADKVGRGYKVYISAEGVGWEVWHIYGNVKIEENSISISGLHVKTSLTDNSAYIGKYDFLRDEKIRMRVKVYGERGSDEQIHGPVERHGKLMWLLKVFEFEYPCNTEQDVDIDGIVGKAEDVEIVIDGIYGFDGRLYSLAYVKDVTTKTGGVYGA